MNKITYPLQESQEWNNLLVHSKILKQTHTKELFKQNPKRFFDFSQEFNGLLLDYSKNKISKKTMSLLFQLAKSRDLKEAKEQLFSGKFSNTTEQKFVSHIQQRTPNHHIQTNTFQEVEQFSKQIRSGSYRGFSGKSIRFVVNIGIGGSHLGLEMVLKALTPLYNPIETFFVSNVDIHSLNQAIAKVNLDETLFIIASKSFSTQETLTNAQTAKKIVLKHFNNEKKAIAKHFCATSNQIELTQKFGIDQVFSIEESIGGRFSLWSAIGLPIALTLGFSAFKKLHKGGHKMDKHFKDAPFDENLPTILALIGIWNINFLNLTTQAILPYCEQLQFFPSFLQQLEMESNGKNVDKDGKPLTYNSCPIIWGSTGTNAQHSFFQFLHQGTFTCPVDFLFILNQSKKNQKHHDILASHFLAQTQALMQGKTLQEVEDSQKDNSIFSKNYKVFQGDKPSNSIVLSKLDAESLGSLIALYEHKVFVQGVIWNIHSFDQWGVEYGKQLAKVILNTIKNNSSKKQDTPHDLLMQYYK